MNVEFFGGIVFAAVVVFIAYRLWRSKKSGRTTGGSGSPSGKNPPNLPK